MTHTEKLKEHIGAKRRLVFESLSWGDAVRCDGTLPITFNWLSKVPPKSHSAENNIWKIKQHGQATRWPALDKLRCISKEIIRQQPGQTVTSSAQCFVWASPFFYPSATFTCSNSPSAWDGVAYRLCVASPIRPISTAILISSKKIWLTKPQTCYDAGNCSTLRQIDTGWRRGGTKCKENPVAPTVTQQLRVL